MPLQNIADTLPEDCDTHSLSFNMRDALTNQIILVVVDGIALEDMALDEGIEQAELKSLFSTY